jgi:hypothetical protein
VVTSTHSHEHTLNEGRLGLRSGVSWPKSRPGDSRAKTVSSLGASVRRPLSRVSTVYAAVRESGFAGECKGAQSIAWMFVAAESCLNLGIPTFCFADFLTQRLASTYLPSLCGAQHDAPSEPLQSPCTGAIPLVQQKIYARMRLLAW